MKNVVRVARPKGGIVNLYLGAEEYAWFMRFPVGKRGKMVRLLIRSELARVIDSKFVEG